MARRATTHWVGAGCWNRRGAGGFGRKVSVFGWEIAHQRSAAGRADCLTIREGSLHQAWRVEVPGHHSLERL
jgi:hypothetical protein